MNNNDYLLKELESQFNTDGKLDGEHSICRQPLDIPDETLKLLRQKNKIQPEKHREDNQQTRLSV